VLEAATAAANSCDVFLSIGTSAVVYPAAGLVHEARRHGALTIEINRKELTRETVDIAIRAPAERCWRSWRLKDKGHGPEDRPLHARTTACWRT
jgi:NAD-dependent deacetylase